MLRLRGLDTVLISKVKGHADEALVRTGRARDLDRLGNNGADEAADFGRRRVPWWTIDARRNFSGVCVLVGVRMFSACIGFLLPLLGLLSIMMVWLVLLWTLSFGLRVVPRRGVALFMLFVVVPFFLGLLESGMENGVLLLCLVLLVMMGQIGSTVVHVLRQLLVLWKVFFVKENSNPAVDSRPALLGPRWRSVHS